MTSVFRRDANDIDALASRKSPEARQSIVREVENGQKNTEGSQYELKNVPDIASYHGIKKCTMGLKCRWVVS